MGSVATQGRVNLRSYSSALFCLTACSNPAAVELVLRYDQNVSSARVRGMLDDGTVLPEMAETLPPGETGSIVLLLPDRYAGRRLDLVVEGLSVADAVVARWSGSIAIESDVARVAIELFADEPIDEPIELPIEGVLVDAAGSSCPFGTGIGSTDDPYCSISDAVAATSSGTIVIAPGTYEEKVEIAGAEKDLHLAASGTVILASAMAPALKIKGLARATIEGLIITGSGGTGGGTRVEMGAAATFTNVTIGPGGGIGIEVKDADLTVERCRIVGNAKGGVSLDGGSHRIESSVIARNGGDESELGGALVAAGASTTILNVTIADNRARHDRAAGIRCLRETEVVNSIVWNNAGDASQVDDLCAPRHCDLAEPHAGEGNISADPRFADDSYHLGEDSPCIDAGDSASAPPRDLDGDATPSGSAADIGADEALR